MPESYAWPTATHFAQKSVRTTVIVITPKIGDGYGSIWDQAVRETNY